MSKKKKLSKDEIKRKVLFTPVNSKQALHNWIKVFLELELPETIVVDFGPNPSNSSPMDLIWEVYDKCLRNDLEDNSRIMAYASRDSAKSLSAAIIEILCVFHLNRDVGHMAAIESQSQNVQKYVRGFLSKPVLRDFVVGNNKTEIEVVRYYNKDTGENLTQKEFDDLQSIEQDFFKKIHRTIQIVIATMTGANSLHVPFLCVDGGTKIIVKTNEGHTRLTAQQIFNKISNGNILESVYIENPKEIVEVLSFSENQGFHFCPIEKGFRQLDQVIEIKTNKTKIVCTKDHPLFLYNQEYKGYAQADKIKVGDVLLMIKDSLDALDSSVVIEINQLKEKQLVYDFTVKNSHNFFANNILSKNCVDEVDIVADEAAYHQSKFIPAPREGNLPMTLLISTRKTGAGLVQRELDNAEKTGLLIRHWNIIDVTAASLDGDVILDTCNGFSKKIKEFVPGDIILGVDDQGQTIATEVLALYDHGYIEGIEITFDDGFKVISSKDHKFLTLKGQIPLEQILLQNLEVLCGRNTKKRWLDESLRSKILISEGIRLSWAKEMPAMQDNYFKKNESKNDSLEERTSRRNEIDYKKGKYWIENMEGEQSRGTSIKSITWDSSCQAMEDRQSEKGETKYKKSSKIGENMEGEQSREGFPNNLQIITFSKKPSFENGKDSSLKQHTDLARCTDQMWKHYKTSRFCITRSQNMDRGRRFLSFFCSQKCQMGYKIPIKESSTTGPDIKRRMSETPGCNVDQAKHGHFYKETHFKTRMEELAFSTAPLSNTGSLVLRRIISIRAVGKRRMYDLEVSHPKHNFLLQNGIVTSNCTPSRHLPDLPKLPIYRSDETLRAISEKDYENLPEDQKSLYVRDQGFAGCLQNCKLFSVCRGALATVQSGKSDIHRPISTTQNRIREASEELVKAELLCWRPGTEGLIYPRFNPDLHMISSGEIYTKITGEQPPLGLGKAELIEFCQKMGLPFYCGMDFGYTHNFAVVVGVKDGNRLYIVDSHAIPELDDSQKIEFCDRKIKNLRPIIFPDPESPSTIKSLKRAGYLVRTWKKGRNTVVSGIQILRSKLMPPMGEPELFFLKEDQGVQRLCESIKRYRWKADKSGVFYDEPDDKDDDELDAIRYLVMNIFGLNGKVVLADKEQVNAYHDSTGPYTKDNWAKKIISEKTGGVIEDETIPEGSEITSKGGLFWSIK